MPPPLRILTADRGDAGRRLDLVLRRHLADVDAATRTRVQAWIENGHVTVNGTPVRRVSARAALGDVVAVALPDAVPRRVMAAEDVRLEQIRVHLAARGWPLVGDSTYGEPRWSQMRDPALAVALRAFPRQALHAWRLAVAHPVTRARLTLEAPVPKDIERLLTASGLDSRMRRLNAELAEHAEKSLGISSLRAPRSLWFKLICSQSLQACQL